MDYKEDLSLSFDITYALVGRGLNSRRIKKGYVYIYESQSGKDLTFLQGLEKRNIEKIRKKYSEKYYNFLKVTVDEYQRPIMVFSGYCSNSLYKVLVDIKVPRARIIVYANE
jgi:hypothetical protein